MRRLLLLLPIALGVSCYLHHPSHAQGYPPTYNSPGGPPPPASSYSAPSAQAYAGSPASTGENCGTPDEPKACPPMPRHPLPYYPANRK
jgi:hypothetical protein